MSTHNFKKGAQWLKCDLHIHTPASLCSDYGGDKEEIWAKFFDELESLSEEIKVLGINDYIFLDGYKKVLEYKNSGGLKKVELLLPVIELRIRDFVGSKELNKINYHIIFADESQLTTEQINTHFLTGLKGKATLDPQHASGYTWGGVITPQSLTEFGKHIYDSTPPEKRSSPKYTEIGFNNITFELSKIFELLGEGSEPNTYLAGKYLKAIGKAEWESFRWDGSPADKKSIINSVDFVFTASPDIEIAQNGKKSLTSQHVNNRLLHCSDAHQFAVDKYKTKPKELGHCFTWIKADPTFDGLKQVLIEPEGRVYIGKTPPIIEKVNNNRTKYIKSLNIDWVQNYKGGDGQWFKQIEIELNHELVAIIGNKGSGKSALADIIGLCGEYKNEDEFSFLHKDKFRKGSLAKNFEAKLNWESNSDSPKNLSNKNFNVGIETVKYLPQGYFETLTNEISTTVSFQKEIENVVFTHISNEDKLGFQSFNELIEHHKAGVEREVSLLRESLIDLNTKIIKLERKINPSYKSEIENKLKQKENELAALTKPPLVENPAEDEAVKLQNSKILSEVNQLSIDIEEIELEINKKEDEKDKLLTELRELADFKKEVEFKISEIKSFKEQKVSIIEKYNLNFDVLLGITSDFASLTTLINSKENELSSIKKLLEEEVLSEPDFITLKKKLNVAQEQLKDKQKQLDSPLLQYQIYLQEVKDWKEKKSKIAGNESTLDTISFFQKELDYLRNSLEGELQRQRESRLNISEKIFEKKQEVIAIYKDVKQKIDSIIVDNSELLGSYKINIDAKLSFDNRFRATFFNNILQNQVGTFYSNDGGNTQLNSIIQDIDFDSKTGVRTFLTNIVDAIFHDKRDRQNDVERYPENQIKDQLKLYNELFSLSFLDYNYQLMQSGKTLQQLSPGERGALLLIFYLLLDKDNKPLIIDQPEDNLDNHSVANILVPFIRKAKTNRQIILVTHNPNLAVVSDAEQIIFVNINKEDNYTFEYISGSIENREINKRIVQVLEGAMPAFNKRKLKYYES